MFTIGREREKAHSCRFLKSQDEAWRIEGVIDAVHDLLDEAKQPEAVAPVFVDAFTNGGAGVWEQTGSWLRKVSRDHPMLGELWREFCRHRSAKVRFRAAAFLADMPDTVFAECFPALLGDPNARVRSKAASDRYQSKDPKIRDILRARFAIETDDNVKAAITFALKHEK
jgi:hypothetical protein